MIAKTLNAENIMTPGRYKLERTGRKVGYNTNNVWTGGAVRAILKDVRYTGLLVQGMTRCSVVGDNRHHLVPREQWHVSPTRHEAIVSEEKYEAVQSLIRSPKSTVRQPQTVHPLSRKVRCGGCGHVMSRNNARNPAYLCGYKALYTDGDCPRKGIKVSVVEETVLAALHGLYTAFAAKEKKLRNRDEKQTAAAMERMRDIQTIERQIDTIENDKLSFYTCFCDGDMAKEEYLRLRDDADRRLQGLIEQVRTMELSICENPKATVSDPLYDTLCDLPFDGGLTREIVVALIDRIIIYDKDRIEIKWTFSDAALITGMEEQIMRSSEKVTAVYCRVAQADSQAIETQKRALIRYAEKQGYGNITVYMDNGFSGLTLNRPELCRLDSDIQAGRVARVIVKDFSRIARSFILAHDWTNRLIEMGIVLIITACPSMDSDLYRRNAAFT